MRLRKVPTRPEWKPLFSARSPAIASWSRFLDPEPAMALAQA
jgi:hypothetical protein